MDYRRCIYVKSVGDILTNFFVGQESRDLYSRFP